MPLTPEDIRATRFRSARMRRGYNQEDVDLLLERVEATLRALDRGEDPGRRGVTAAAIESSSFRSTFMTTGYDEGQVDDLLDEIAAELRARESGERGAADPAHGDGPDPARGDRPRTATTTSGADEARPTGMTPADVRNRYFDTTRMHTGYDEEEVDSFLDHVEATLVTLRDGKDAPGATESGMLTAARVRAERFTTTRLRPGYAPDQVDAFLDEVAAELERHGLN
ncbi:DivIVA domain-containing protein [Murinocardiopsis flavida]|uniref:Cell wall synthesis protein Wag31 n=1 Tax=Murinocardiopsis flavida TaxID=645275 RepID=A0A2P8DQS6_9ACTN|nr:DivIVA domain-containing protein [Murinocardiopsis flavida]PSK99568.1 DivIVA domain-containing protein [Murinocardiopsis flavida]